MRFGWHTCFKCQLYRTQNGAFVVLQNERQDIHHLPVAAFLAQHLILQVAEGVRHLREWRTVAKCSRFALDDSEIVPPVIDALTGLAVRSLNNPRMLTNGLPFGDDTV